MLEARNPQQIEPPADETAEESDSGEGRLGGPNGSLRGPPSALNGAGVEPASLRPGARSAPGAAMQASNSLITKTSPHDTSIGLLHGDPVYGPQRPAHLLRYGEQGTSNWNFDSLNDAPEADDPAETLITHLDNPEDNDDAASNTAVADNGYDDRIDELDPFENNNTTPWSTAGRNTPDSDWPEYHDDHRMYSGAHEPRNADFDALHLEEAGMPGEEAIDIYPDNPPIFSMHDKMD